MSILELMVLGAMWFMFFFYVFTEKGTLADRIFRYPIFNGVLFGLTLGGVVNLLWNQL